jgi:hypothetical protein
MTKNIVSYTNMDCVKIIDFVRSVDCDTNVNCDTNLGTEESIHISLDQEIVSGC